MLDLKLDVLEDHAPNCVASLDDESDYKCLSDAGNCTCGAYERNKVLLKLKEEQDGARQSH